MDFKSSIQKAPLSSIDTPAWRRDTSELGRQIEARGSRPRRYLRVATSGKASAKSSQAR